MKIIYYISMIFLFSQEVHSDEFKFSSVDCKKPEFSTQKKICWSKELVEIKDEIDSLYKTILLKNKDFRKVLIVDTQFSYFGKLNDCNILDTEDIMNCFLSTMNERLSLLKSVKKNNRDVFNYLTKISHIEHDVFWKYGHLMLNKEVEISGTVLYENIGSIKGMLVDYDKKSLYPEIPVRLKSPISEIDYNRFRRLTTWTGIIRKENDELYFELDE